MGETCIPALRRSRTNGVFVVTFGGSTEFWQALIPLREALQSSIEPVLLNEDGKQVSSL